MAGIALSGILYNVGLTAGPFFEGQLAQCLIAVMAKEKTVGDMVNLAGLYLAVILLVQASRCLKRFWFAGSPTIPPVQCAGCCTAIWFIKIRPFLALMKREV
ncbi:MAG: hypothetical protein ACLSA6_10870 [Holdemania massiliensis]